MGKNSNFQDEVPLTLPSPSRPVMQETRTRFDHLLRVALSQDKNSKKRSKFKKKKENIEMVECAKKPISKEEKHNIETDSNKNYESQLNGRHNASTGTLLSTVDLSSSSDDDVLVIEGNSINKDEVSSSMPQPKPRKKITSTSKPETESLSRTGVISPLPPPSELKYKSPSKSVNDNTEPRENNSYKTAHRAMKEMSLEFVKPTPLPRVKSSKGISPKFQQSESREPMQNFSSNISVCKEQAPPLYSQTGISYENLEKDGGPVTSEFAVCDTRQKTKEGGDTNMQKSAPAASYEEITPSPKHSHIDHPDEHTSPPPSVLSHRDDVTLTYEKIIGVIVHKCDVLQMHSLIQHPLVKVSIVDLNTGKYVKKSDPKRPVSYFAEQHDVDYVSPLMTHEFNFLSRRSLVPMWEEQLIFNEDITCITKKGAPVLILFEIMDFVSFAVASTQYKKLGPEGGWHKIAWAFLKPVGLNGNLNIEEQHRLQLYKPRCFQKANCETCDVFSWWNKGSWKKYPGTIYVTIKGIQPPDNLPPALRPRIALQGEIRSVHDMSIDEFGEKTKSEDIDFPSTSESNIRNSSPMRSIKWSRIATQSCKVPNKLAKTLPSASSGCFIVKFSHSGLYLACATLSKDTYNILIYTIPDGKECAQLTGHQGLVYDLHWSPNDRFLLSASADSTACVWSLKTKKHTHLLQMLPHPTFVYCAKFSNSDSIFTGCKDHVIRIWRKTQNSSKFQLIQECEEHKGFVTALCCESSGILISGDSVGRIIVWPSLAPDSRSVDSPRDLNLRELQNIVINELILHPGGQRLLIHARDNLLRMVDIASASIIQWFQGGLNYRVQTFSCITPCGGLVMAASEDGTVRVWNADTGDQVAIYSGLQSPSGSSGVDYHPYEHMAAFSSTGSAVGILLCTYDKSSNGSSVGLTMLSKQAFHLEDKQTSKVTEDSKLSALINIKHSSKMSNQDSLNIPENNHSKNITDADESSASVFSQPSYSFPTSTQQYNNQDKSDAQSSDKLSNIIDKIDKVLSSTTSSKTNSHVSDTMTPRKESLQENVESINEKVKVSSARRRRQALKL